MNSRTMPNMTTTTTTITTASTIPITGVADVVNGAIVFVTLLLLLLLLLLLSILIPIPSLLLSAHVCGLLCSMRSSEKSPLFDVDSASNREQIHATHSPPRSSSHGSVSSHAGAYIGSLSTPDVIDGQKLGFADSCCRFAQTKSSKPLSVRPETQSKYILESTYSTRARYKEKSYNL